MSPQEEAAWVAEQAGWTPQPALRFEPTQWLGRFRVFVGAAYLGDVAVLELGWRAWTPGAVRALPGQFGSRDEAARALRAQGG